MHMEWFCHIVLLYCKIHILKGCFIGTVAILWLPQFPWWCHQKETFSVLLAICAGNSPVPGEFPAQMPVTWSFNVFFDLHLNKRLSRQSWGWWFETISCPFWRHCNDWSNPESYGESWLAHKPEWGAPDIHNSSQDAGILLGMGSANERRCYKCNIVSH